MHSTIQNAQIIYSFLLINIVFFIYGCSDNESYPDPTIVTPESGAVYYPSQEVRVKWNMLDSTMATEMQTWASSDKSFFENPNTVFDTVRSWLRISNTTSHTFYISHDVTEELYFGVRIRYKTPVAAGNWTPVRFFTVLPYSSLIVKDLTIKANFKFTTTTPDYFSANEIFSSNAIDLDNELEKSGYGKENLVFIKLASGSIKDSSPYAHHLEGMAFDFNQDSLDRWGDASKIATEPAIMFYPAAGVYRDVYKEIGGGSRYMRASYYLSPYYNLEDQVGKEHDVTIELKLRCYYK